MLHRCDVRDGEGWRGGDRTDEARKRHENHGNRGSSWIAALGQHACRQSPRSSAGTAMLRLLHDRGQAGEFDRRSRLRQRSTRRGVAQGRHRDDRAASQQQKQAAHARSATAKPLYATLARGALLCLDSMAAPHPCPLGILRPELPRLRTARLPRCPLQAILRQVLDIASTSRTSIPSSMEAVFQSSESSARRSMSGPIFFAMAMPCSRPSCCGGVKEPRNGSACPWPCKTTTAGGRASPRISPAGMSTPSRLGPTYLPLGGAISWPSAMPGWTSASKPRKASTSWRISRSGTASRLG